MHAQEKMIVALDVSSARAAMELARQLHGRVGMFKVGLEAFTAEGPPLIRELVRMGEQVFLDLKLHDIPNTVRAAAFQAGGLAGMITVHASGGKKMIAAAVEGVRAAAGAARAPRPARVLAVTALTSLAAEDLAEIGFWERAEDVVVRLAGLAQAAGADGVVASPREVAPLRQACGRGFLIVTPGIRPQAVPGAQGYVVHDPSHAIAFPGITYHADDQARVDSPAHAIRAGADYLVVGRPITQAPDPAAAADAIAAEIEQVGL